jgi:hypothetical protein
MILHDELDNDGNDVRIERTRQEAIQYQKIAAFTAKRYVYASDEKALSDYMTIHWAWDDEGTIPKPSWA